ncbi:MAG TPA: ABC transporter permease [Myxococcales bacterium]|nr:ABC transporter permease [Myxococcales bacterium]
MAAPAPAPVPAPRRVRRPLWALRTSIPEGTARLLAASSVALVLLVWCILSYVTVDKGAGRPEPLVSHFFLPPPDEVLRGLLYLLFNQGLLSAVGVSVVRILKAFGLSVAVAVPLGIFMGSFEAANRFFDSILAPMRYLPITAFIPLLILWFGIEEEQKVAFLFLGTFVFLLPVVVDAIKVVPEELVQTAFTLGATKAQVIRTVLIPAALPQIFDSFRVMNAIAWTYIILAEIVNPQNGIGYILRLAEQHTKPAWSFAGILVVGIIGLLTDLLIRGLNRLLFSWREADV